MTETSSIRVEIRNEEEFIRLADEAVRAIIEVDNRTPLSQGPLGARATRIRGCACVSHQVAGRSWLPARDYKQAEVDVGHCRRRQKQRCRVEEHR